MSTLTKFMKTTMTKEEAIVKLNAALDVLYTVCDEMDWGDPFAAGRIREIILANYLNHKIGESLHKEDAINEDGDKIEYKTVLELLGLKGRYDVSWQPTWELQLDYLKNEKIANNKFHYFATFTNNCKLVSVYQMTGEKALELLLPKIQKKFNNFKAKEKLNLKNMSLHATLSKKQIIENSIKIL